MNDAPYTGRFAPSPTGPLHLGHAFSALTAYHRARQAAGRFLLRIEDLDHERSRPEFADAIESDLSWLGVEWDGPVLRQSTRAAAYEDALARLTEMGLTYPCKCSRRDIQEAASAPHEGTPAHGPDGLVYPGTCRGDPHVQGDELALRLDLARAIEMLGGDAALARLSYIEAAKGEGVTTLDATALRTGTGDIVLRRRNGAAAYHLAVVIDDAFQGVTHVTRGEDLKSATPIQRTIQAILGLATPIYFHHELIRDPAGRRLAKRDRDMSICEFRSGGARPEDLRARLGFTW